MKKNAKCVRNKPVAKNRVHCKQEPPTAVPVRKHIPAAVDTLRLQTLRLQLYSKRRNQRNYEWIFELYGGFFLQGSLRKERKRLLFFLQTSCQYTNANARVTRNIHPWFEVLSPDISCQQLVRSTQPPCKNRNLEHEKKTLES